MTTHRMLAEQMTESGVDCPTPLGSGKNDALGTPAPKPSLDPYPEYIPETAVPRPPGITDELKLPRPGVEQQAENTPPPPPKEIPTECLLLSEGLPKDALMANIVRALDDSGAGRGLNTSQRDNVLAAAYRSFAPSVDHVGVYNGQLVGTRAPHGLGTEPMDNLPLSIADATRVPAQTSLTQVPSERNLSALASASPFEEPQRGIKERTV
jgi:hypothetical protein